MLHVAADVFPQGWHEVDAGEGEAVDDGWVVRALAHEEDKVVHAAGRGCAGLQRGVMLGVDQVPIVGNEAGVARTEEAPAASPGLSDLVDLAMLAVEVEGAVGGGEEFEVSEEHE
ncbi:hypothetical protein D3C87_1304860 [compost metagenome]